MDNFILRHSFKRGSWLLLVGLLLYGYSARLSAGDVSEVPPENYSACTHNVLLLLDNSNRMDAKLDGTTYQGAASVTSKSYIARQAVIDLLNKLSSQPQPRLNLGLMFYNPSSDTPTIQALGSLDSTTGVVNSGSTTTNKTSGTLSNPTAWRYPPATNSAGSLPASLPEAGYLAYPVQAFTSTTATAMKNLLASGTSLWNVPNSSGSPTPSNAVVKNVGGSPVSGVVYKIVNSVFSSNPVACDNTLIMITGSRPDTNVDGKTSYTSASYPPSGIEIITPDNPPPQFTPDFLADDAIGIITSNPISYRKAYIIALADTGSTSPLPALSPVSSGGRYEIANGVNQSTGALRHIDLMALYTDKAARVYYPRMTASVTVAPTWSTQVVARYDLAAALDRIMHFVMYSTPYVYTNNISASAATSNSTSLQPGTMIIQARMVQSAHDPWYSNIHAYPINPNTGDLLPAKWSTFSASKFKVGLINNWSSRLIYSYDPLQSKGITFQWADPANGTNLLNTKQRGALAQGFDSTWYSTGGSNDYPSPSPALISERGKFGNFLVNYLKGQGTFETNAAPGVIQPYFNNTSLQQVAYRYTLLGAVAHSDLAFVGAQNFAYDALPEGADFLPDGSANPNSYRQFLRYKSERKRVVYFGANDGMLHGIDAGTYPFSGSDADTYGTGDEVFGYVPSAVIGPRLANLAKWGDPFVRFYYTVDGSPVVGDAYLNNTNSIKGWNSVLVGTLGAGGKSVFALDVTCPVASDVCLTGFTKSNVMWEISDSDDTMSVWWKRDRDPSNTTSTDFSSACRPGVCPDTATGSSTSIHGDLGYTLPKTAVVRMNNGDWAALVPNGYNSINGHAVLFIFKLKDGSLIRKIDTGVAGTTVDKNGLSSITAVDIDGNRTADYLYAGDLRGNFWKFDVRSSNSSSWGVANNAPLFVACASGGCASLTDPNRQPIFAKPAMGPGPVTNGRSMGVMLYFGTGKNFEVNDNYNPSSPAPQVQTFYALWDNDSGIILRNQLQAQTIDSTSSNLRLTSNNAVDYATQKGWLMNLSSNTGERIVAEAKLNNGRIIFVTLIPAPTSPSADHSQNGTGWMMELNALDGSRLAPGTPPFDSNGDKNINAEDLVNGQSPGGILSPVGILTPPVILQAPTLPGGELKGLSGTGVNSTTTLGTLNESGPPRFDTGRASWKQVPSP